MLIFGLTGALGTWIVNEFSERSGVIGGNDLFVIRSKRDANIHYLAAEGSVTEGKLLVEFTPPGIAAQLTVLDSQIKEAEAKLQALDLSPLVIDSTLLHEQSQLQAQINQMKNVKPELQKAKRDIEKDIHYYQMAWTREKSQIETELATAQQSLSSSTDQIKLATDAFTRAEDLQKRNNISVQALEERNSALLALKFQKNKALADIGMLESRLSALDERYQQTAQSLKTHFTAVDAELTSSEQVIEELEASHAKVTGLLLDDRARASETLVHEKEGARYQLSALSAERDRIQATTQETAPFAGSVVYRHPSPGLAPENAPVLAFASAGGFNARIMIPANDLESLAEAGEVKFSLEDPVLTKFFRGSFTKAEAEPSEPNTAIAHFDVHLPTEAITLLAQSGQPVRARLHWQPDLLASNIFRGGVGFMGVGLVGMLFSSRGRRQIAGQLEIPSEARGYVALPMGSDHDLAALINSEQQQSHRLSSMASSFHLLLRQGGLTPDIVISMEALINQFGDAAVRAIRSELIFDQELTQAVQEWDQKHPGGSLDIIMDRVHDMNHIDAA
jgi:hypothetical protein